MNKIISILAVMSASIALSVLVLMYGWGLHPQNWWWILGGGIVAQTVLRSLADKVIKSDG